MIWRVVWSPAALSEISRIYGYVADFNPAAAKGDSLSHFPYRGRRVGGKLREIVPLYPYIIRYEVNADEVQIL